MKIDHFSLPLDRPLETAAGPVAAREGFLVDLAVDGVRGVGEATPLAGWTESLADCEAALRTVAESDRLLDGSPAADDIDSLAERPAARHGLSLAVLDARAREADVPLYRYLGGERDVDAVPVNTVIGDGSPETTAAAAEAAVADGVPAVKVKIGVRPPSADVERLRVVSERCPDVELRVDVNGAWDRDTAAQTVPELAALGVSVVEQPLAATDLTGHAALRGEEVDVAVDEGLVCAGLEAILAADAADVVVCKPMALGGVDRAFEIARRAMAAGVDPIVTTTIDAAVARTAAVHVAAAIGVRRPCGLATADRLSADVGPDPTSIADGSITVPQGKGNIPPS